MISGKVATVAILVLALAPFAVRGDDEEKDHEELKREMGQRAYYLEHGVPASKYGYAFSTIHHDRYTIGHKTIVDPYPCEPIKVGDWVELDWYGEFEVPKGDAFPLEPLKTNADTPNAGTAFHRFGGNLANTNRDADGKLEYNGRKTLSFFFKDPSRREAPIPRWIEAYLERGLNGMCEKEHRYVFVGASQEGERYPARDLYGDLLPPFHGEEQNFPEAYSAATRVPREKGRSTGLFKIYVHLRTHESKEARLTRLELEAGREAQQAVWQEDVKAGRFEITGVTPDAELVGGVVNFEVTGHGLVPAEDEIAIVGDDQDCSNAYDWYSGVTAFSPTFPNAVYFPQAIEFEGDYHVCYKFSAKQGSNFEVQKHAKIKIFNTEAELKSAGKTRVKKDEL